jgi:hypothetical protein
MEVRKGLIYDNSTYPPQSVDDALYRPLTQELFTVCYGSDLQGTKVLELGGEFSRARRLHAIGTRVGRCTLGSKERSFLTRSELEVVICRASIVLRLRIALERGLSRRQLVEEVVDRVSRGQC